MTMADHTPTSRRPAIPVDARAKLGQKLKASYDLILNEPVPDRFQALLDQLDSAQPAAPPKGGDRTGAGA